ncbi:hypothetical protein QBC37DRAFT_380357 [Rhypophila decipiens]|uniref:Uncharacterized protein n=1 Tax=Rhypophila decipiens TaxID=261697 RepID=A0AAN7B191_9PEZI|nr:hypothetical protein QBC37DRAFT_380357 [Rhypophila decipiens]
MSAFKFAIIFIMLALGWETMSQEDTPWVLVCEHPNWEGRCAYLRARAGDCTNVPGDWNDIISSIRNDDANIFQCTWFEDIDCGGSSDDKQENDNLNNGDGYFNDRISSWNCERRDPRDKMDNEKVDL